MTGVRAVGILLLPTVAVTSTKNRPRAGGCRGSIEKGTTAWENVMAYIRLPYGVKIAVEYTWNGELVLNIYHVAFPAPVTLVNLNAAVLAVEGWVTDNLMPNLSVTCAATGVTATNLDVENGEQVYLPITPPEDGAVLGESMPNNIAQVCSFYTAKTGRSYRGRAYVPGMAELYVDNNYVNAGVAAEIALTYSELQDILFLIGCELVVASFEHDSAPRAEGIATRVESFACNLRVDTQRRRLPKD